MTVTILHDGDADLAIYKAALATAEAERKRLDRAIASYGTGRTTPAMIKRQRILLRTIEGLRELAKEPPTH